MAEAKQTKKTTTKAAKPKATKAPKAELKEAELAAVAQTTEKLAELAEAEAIAEAIVEAEHEIETEEKEVKTAKAGKRSAKALAEAEEKQAKSERKAKGESDEQAVAKKVVTKTRSRLERKGKKFREAAKLIDRTSEYPVGEALELVVKTSTAKFDATVELHINLGVDPRHADQNIRGTLVLPAGTGKSIRVAVFADGDDIAAATKAGADIAAGDELLQQLEKGTIDFDVLVATPAVMPKLGKYARILGPKGLMPSPKSGTVTTDVAKAVSEAKAGKVEYRVDTAGIVHMGIGKVSFGADKLTQNANSVISSVKAAKPASVKGTYLKSAYLTSTMGPSVKVATGDL